MSLSLDPIRPYADLIKLLLAVALGCLLLYAGQTVLEWRNGAIKAEQQGHTMKATVGVIEDGAKADADRQATDAGVATARDTFNSDTNEARIHEPETAARADRSVPPSVRNAYHARRLARERSGGGGVERGAGPADSPPPQR